MGSIAWQCLSQSVVKNDLLSYISYDVAELIEPDRQVDYCNQLFYEHCVFREAME